MKPVVLADTTPYKLPTTDRPQAHNLLVMAAVTQLKLMLHDRVVAKGRVGVVVGFYHCEEEWVLVSFSLDDAVKYRASDVALLMN
jgi:hypothetical protein